MITITNSSGFSNTVPAIKALRNLTGCSLREAKTLVDEAREKGSATSDLTFAASGIARNRFLSELRDAGYAVALPTDMITSIAALIPELAERNQFSVIKHLSAALAELAELQSQE